MGKSQVVVGVIFMMLGLGLPLTFNVAGVIYGGILFLMGMFLVIYRNAESEIEKIKGKEVGKK